MPDFSPVVTEPAPANTPSLSALDLMLADLAEERAEEEATFHGGETMVAGDCVGVLERRFRD